MARTGCLWGGAAERALGNRVLWDAGMPGAGGGDEYHSTWLAARLGMHAAAREPVRLPARAGMNRHMRIRRQLRHCVPHRAGMNRICRRHLGAQSGVPRPCGDEPDRRVDIVMTPCVPRPCGDEPAPNSPRHHGPWCCATIKMRAELTGAGVGAR